MAVHVLADAGFLVALLSRRDEHHRWAEEIARQFPPPWHTCESSLSEAFHLVGAHGTPALAALLHRKAVTIAFDLNRELGSVLTLLRKYGNVPMSLADACLVRMTESLADPVLLTTDADFRIYRRHSRQLVPCRMPA